MAPPSWIILYLFTLTLTKLTGFILFFNYFLRLNQSRFLLVSLGWLISILGAGLFLISMYSTIPEIISLTYVISSISMSWGILAIGVGIMSYFQPVKKEIFAIGTAVFILLPIIVFFTSEKGFAGMLTTIEQLIVYLFMIFEGIKHRNRVLEFSRGSYALYMTGVTLSFLSTISIMIAGSSFSELIVIIYFGLDIWLSVVLILFLIHLEHNISLREKFLLKDAFSHEMAQLLQLAVAHLDLGLLSNEKTEYEQVNTTLQKASDLLIRIRKL
ncbi:MAG: hypothetical protein EAX86_10135 [Candidatus Heimdallarchaeota archaeon]|nr:hypothetical protein [Candidatus Heimdallarchaeota archaeon]